MGWDAMVVVVGRGLTAGVEEVDDSVVCGTDSDEE